MDNKDIFNLNGIKRDFYCGIPYVDAISSIEKANFKLLAENCYSYSIESKKTNFRLYYHEITGCILKIESDALEVSSLLKNAVIYSQISYNLHPTVATKVLKMGIGGGGNHPTGFGSWIACNYIAVNSNFIGFLKNLQEIYDLSPQAFYKDSALNSVYVDELILSNGIWSEEKDGAKKFDSFLEKIPACVIPFLCVCSGQPKNRPIIYWNSLLERNIGANSKYELSYEDTKIVGTYNKIMEATDVLDIKDLSPINTTSIGINILHALPFVNKKENIYAVLNYLVDNYSVEEVNKLLNAQDYFGETPFFTVFKNIVNNASFEQKENNKNLFMYYAKNFQKMLKTFNNKEGVSNIISDTLEDVNLELFLLAKEAKLEWWNKWHKKYTTNTGVKKSLYSYDNPLDVIACVANSLPEERRMEAYENYYEYVRQNLNAVIDNKKSKGKILKI